MQHTTHQALILQAADPMPVPVIAEWQQFGLVGVLAIMLAREGLTWWRGKEAAEALLVSSLVADLRTANQSLVDKLFAMQEKQVLMQAQQHSDQVELMGELRALGARIDKLL